MISCLLNCFHVSLTCLLYVHLIPAHREFVGRQEESMAGQRTSEEICFKTNEMSLSLQRRVKRRPFLMISTVKLMCKALL